MTLTFNIIATLLTISPLAHRSRLRQLVKCQLDLLLQLLVGDIHAVLVITTDKHDLFRRARIQLVQALDDVSHVDLWSQGLGFACVEQVISEQLQDISLADLAPLLLSFVLGPLIDQAKLADEADQTAILEFFHQKTIESIVGVQRRVI